MIQSIPASVQPKSELMQRLLGMPDLCEMPIVGIIRNMAYADFIDVLPVYIESGLRVVEITMNTPEAGKMIAYANKKYAGKLTVGAGTVCSLQDLKLAMSAGARFVVTPVVDEQVISRSVKANIPIFPGAFTPTEIYRAWHAGASAVKIFPAASLGVQFVKDVLAPLDQIALMPTGGVDQRNIVQYFKAGAVAVGMGGKLFNQAMIREKNWNGLIEHLAVFVKAARAFAITRPA